MKSDILTILHTFIYENIFKYQRITKWALAFAVAACILLLYEFNLLERLELITLDYRFLLRPTKARASDIILIDMEDDSIRAIGRWPWPRKWHATLIRALSEYNPKLIAFDVIFSEPQDNTDDSAFEEAMKEARIVYLPVLYNLETQETKHLYTGEGVSSVFESLPRFRKWAKGTGHLNIVPDADGVIRRIVPFIDYEGKRIYQFGFKIGSDLARSDVEGIAFDAERHFILIKKPHGKEVRVPLDRNNQLIINWRGRWGRVFRHFRYIDVITSYASLTEGKKPLIDLSVFRNKICIIGLTATALMDIKPAPIEKAYPAVGVHAMVINSVVNNDFVREVPEKFDKFLILLISIVMTFLLFKIRPLAGLFFTAASTAGYAVISVAIFNLFNAAVITVYPLLAILVSYGVSTAYTHALQTIERSYLVKQATLDELTGLYNIRYFNLLLETEFKHISLHRHRRFSLIMSDLDNFKEINDTYGHQAGDTALREIARIMQSKCRQTDVVARYGGEEIIIMLMGTVEEDAVNIAEGIRSAVQNNKIRFKDVSYNITISSGVVEFYNEKTKEEIVEKSDKALYKAKQGGKNRVCVYKRDGTIETV